MKTLTIDFTIRFEVGLKLTGLSMKAVGGNISPLDIIRPDVNTYALTVPRWHINGETAQPELSSVVESLTEIHRRIPFQKVKIVGSYSAATGEEIMEMILKRLFN